MSQVLYVTGQSIRIYEASRSGVKQLGRFANDAVGYEELRTALAAASAEPTAILVDLIEEEFRQETLPHTLGRDRARLHARQASKLFRSTPFRHCQPVGREKEGRRDDKVLFSALTNRDNIEPVLDIVEASGIPVRAIHSLPMLTERLVKPLGARSGNVLAITGQAEGGLRETFLRDGQVHFSRLAPETDSSPQDYCRLIDAEAHKTQRYLHTLRLLGRDELLEVYLLTDTSRVEALGDRNFDTANLRFHPVEVGQFARLAGYKNYPLTPFSDALFTYLVASHRIRNHYARPTDLRRFRTAQIKLGLRAATWLIAIGSVVLAGVNTVDGLLMNEERQQVHRAVAQVDSAYQRVVHRLPVEPTTALAMREAIHVADHLQARSVDLDRLFRLTGTAFAGQPNLVVKTFKWFVTVDPQAASLTDLSDENAETIEPARYLVSTIIAQLRQFNGSYRQAHDQVERLSAWIKDQPGVVEAVTVRKPLDTSTKSDLQGGIAKRDEQERVDFELRVVMELEDGSV